MSRPEIARITPFERNETVQIFGENFTEKAKVYWWRPNINQDTDRALHFTPDKSALPKSPPEDALLYKVDNVCDSQVLFVAAEKNKVYENCYSGKNDGRFCQSGGLAEAVANH